MTKYTLLTFGIKVKTLKPLHNDTYTEETQAKRKWDVNGTIVAHHNSHGLCYDVQHEDGSVGSYDEDEIQVLSRVKINKYYFIQKSLS